MSHIKYRNLYAGLAKCDAGGKQIVVYTTWRAETLGAHAQEGYGTCLSAVYTCLY